MSGDHLRPSTTVARPACLITAGALALALLAALAGTGSKEASAQTCAGSFTIDFAGLPAGTIIGEQYAAQGVHISGEANNNGPDALIVFDSNSTDSNLDPDLRVGIGNIAIFANNLDDANGDGLVDSPDENNFGGRAVFRFDQDVSIGSFKFVDKDAPPPDSAVAYDASGNVIKQVPIPQAGNASVQTIAVNADGVRRLEIVYGDSGGFTGIEVDCPQQPTASPTGTAIARTPSPTAQAETPTPTPTPAAPTPTPAGATPTPTAAGETPTPAPPGETASPTPAAQAETPTPTPTAQAAAPTPTPTQTPTVAGAQSSPPPVQGAAVAGEVPGGRPGTTVLGAQALPAGGGAPARGSMTWAAPLIVLALVLGGTLFSMRRQRR